MYIDFVVVLCTLVLISNGTVPFKVFEKMKI